jgi:hypothetical protein
MLDTRQTERGATQERHAFGLALAEIAWCALTIRLNALCRTFVSMMVGTLRSRGLLKRDSPIGLFRLRSATSRRK